MHAAIAAAARRSVPVARTLCTSSKAAAAAAAAAAPAAASSSSPFLLVLPSLAVGAAAGWVARKEYASYTYAHSLSGRVGKVVTQEDIKEIKSASQVYFSASEVKNLYAALPKWDVTFFEFKAALNRIGKPLTDGEAEALFRMFDLNHNGSIQSIEFITVLSVFCRGTDKERASLLFRIWDSRNDGKITRKDMRESYKKMDKHRVLGRAFTSAMFWLADSNNDGELTEEEFVAHPATVAVMTKVMMNTQYRKYLSEENFAKMAAVLSEEYNAARQPTK